MCGRDYLEAVKTEKIKNQDIIIQISLNGAQLYCNKELDC